MSDNALTPPLMACPHCDHDVDHDGLYCPQCGHDCQPILPAEPDDAPRTPQDAVDALKVLTKALHDQEHEPVEDLAEGDPENIVCAGDVEVAEGIVEYLAELDWRLQRVPDAREDVAECGFGEPHEPHEYVVADNGKPLALACPGLAAITAREDSGEAIWVSVGLLTSLEAQVAVLRDESEQNMENSLRQMARAKRAEVQVGVLRSHLAKVCDYLNERGDRSADENEMLDAAYQALATLAAGEDGTE